MEVNNKNMIYLSMIKQQEKYLIKTHYGKISFFYKQTYTLHFVKGMLQPIFCIDINKCSDRE